MTPPVLAAALVALFACSCTAAPHEASTMCPANVPPPSPPPGPGFFHPGPSGKPGAGGGMKSKYTTKYDNINIDMILANERLLKNYMDCLMDRKVCSREGQLLKEIIPDALANECQHCTEKQKVMAGHIMSHLLQYKKHYWDELLCKYDPEGKFREKYEVDEDEEDDE